MPRNAQPLESLASGWRHRPSQRDLLEGLRHPIVSVAAHESRHAMSQVPAIKASSGDSALPGPHIAVVPRSYGRTLCQRSLEVNGAVRHPTRIAYQSKGLFRMSGPCESPALLRS